MSDLFSVIAIQCIYYIEIVIIVVESAIPMLDSNCLYMYHGFRGQQRNAVHITACNLT